MRMDCGGCCLLCGTVVLHECRLPCGFTDVVSSHTAVDHHCLHRHVVSDCVGIRYYVCTSAIITHVGIHGTAQCQTENLIPQTNNH